MDLDFSFDDVDLGCQFKSSTKALAKLAAGKKTPLKRLESSASVATGSRESLQQANEQLAIEDAEEMDKLLVKAEEAVQCNACIMFKAKKLAKASPPTVLANMRGERLEELKVAVEEYTAQLESITINGTMPGEPKPVSMAILKVLLKDGMDCTKDLSQACLMAQSLMPNKVKDIEIP